MLQSKCKEENKDGGILIKPLSKQITIDKNIYYKKSMTQEDFDDLINKMRSFGCLYLYKKEYTIANFLNLHDELK